VRNPYNFLSDILRRKNKIYTPACYCALRHIWLPGRVGLLRDGNAPHVLYAAQCCCTITVIAGDNDCDKFAVPVLRQGTQKMICVASIFGGISGY